MHQHKESRIVHRDSIFFHEFTNSLGIKTLQGIHVPERINYTSNPPQHTLKPTASSCSLGQLENECVREERDRDLPLECLHFPLNPRFTERFWHLSKYFSALATTSIPSSRATLPLTKFISSMTPFTYNLASYTLHKWMSTTPNIK